MREGEQVIAKSLAFDSIETAGMTIWIPYYYEIKNGIINSCPKFQTKVRQGADVDSAT